MRSLGGVVRRHRHVTVGRDVGVAVVKVVESVLVDAFEAVQVLDGLVAVVRRRRRLLCHRLVIVLAAAFDRLIAWS